MRERQGKKSSPASAKTDRLERIGQRKSRRKSFLRSAGKEGRSVVFG